MNKIKSRYGVLDLVQRFTTYPDGAVRTCSFTGPNLIETKYGTFTPHFTDTFQDERRRKKNRSALAFHPNGGIKSLSLEAQSPVNTALGIYPAELVTFDENGNLNRLFPLNGQITGFWSENDEADLAPVFDFDFPFGHFSAKIICLRFYPNGALQTLTLFPGEVVTLSTSVGDISVRQGFSLYEDGNLKSIEPAAPTKVKTPVGDIFAYDIDAIGIHADQNSLAFNPDGSMLGLITTHTGLCMMNNQGESTHIKPMEIESIIDETETTIMPVKISFSDSHIQLSQGSIHHFDLSEHKIYPYLALQPDDAACGGSCSSCSGCGH